MFADDPLLRPTTLAKPNSQLRFLVKAHQLSSWLEFSWCAFFTKRTALRSGRGRRWLPCQGIICEHLRAICVICVSPYGSHPSVMPGENKPLKLQMLTSEIDQQPSVKPADLQVIDQLLLLGPSERRDCFDLQNDGLIAHEIRPEPAFKPRAFVIRGELHLTCVLNLSVRELDTKRVPVDTLKQPRAELTVDLHRRADDGVCLRVPNRIRQPGDALHPSRWDGLDPNSQPEPRTPCPFSRAPLRHCY